MSVDDVRFSIQGEGMLLLNAIIGLIMFGIALDLRLRDFALVAQRPKAPLIGLVSQFGILPALSFLLTLLLQPGPSIALGMILVAACPSGNLSNFLTHMARGNTALSVTVTACSTVLAVFITPLNLSLWGSLNPQTSQLLTEVHLDPAEMFLTISLIIGIPIGLGMLCAHLLPSLASRLHRPFKVFSLLAFVTFVVIAFVQNFAVFRQYVGLVALAVFLQNALALATGYGAAWMGGLPERDRRATSIEVGIHNSALGLALAFRYFDTLGGIALVAGWWGIWHAITGLTLASFWARRPAEDVSEGVAS